MNLVRYCEYELYGGGAASEEIFIYICMSLLDLLGGNICVVTIDVYDLTIKNLYILI